MATSGNLILAKLVPGADWIMDLVVRVEAQIITLTGATGGTWKAAFMGQTTAAGIAWNAPAATVQAALEGLSTIRPGNVAVTGSAGGPWSVQGLGPLDIRTATTFRDNRIGVDFSSLTPTSASGAADRPVANITGRVYAFYARVTPPTHHASDLVLTQTNVPGVGVIVNGGAAGVVTLHVYAARTAALNWADAPNGTILGVLTEDTGDGPVPLADFVLTLDPSLIP